MNFRILSVEHDRQGLAEVQRVSQHADALSASLSAIPGVAGVVTLNTCNRVEFLLDAPDVSESHLRLRLARELAPNVRWNVYEQDHALDHLFRVASGLSSMVVGEREIAGQLRRALRSAAEVGRATGNLTQVVNAALHTSRRVGAETRLQGSGRSLVSVGLEMTGIEDWAAQRALIVGTGSFAGAVVAALRHRGVSTITVHSASGRAQEFAATRGLEAAEDLVAGLAASTLVVTCRGTGVPVIHPEHVAGTPVRVLLDLALHPDVAPEVADLPGVSVVNLLTIQDAISPEWAADTAHADQLVQLAVTETTARLASRAADPAVASLRESVLAIVDEEVARLPQGRALTVEDCAQALRRLATRFLHTPSARARDAAMAGRIDDYLAAIEELYGIDMSLESPAPEERRCPMTGLSFADLEHPHVESR
ncbi:glutamyl-tRNA reductase [Arachnia propionica]|uniref:glutamyl-tRNA reductase n=1 Tax=Arachnia propionica TaxID=1750 RepID=UPI00163998AC|nr:glutamyl-tRNA reductase [Arachnia propionica]